MLSVDENALNPKSATGIRMKEYETLVDELRVVVIRARHPLRSIGRIFGATRNIKRSDGWLVTSQDPFEVGLVALCISKLFRIPLHVQVHIDFFSPYFKTESLRQSFQATIAPFVLKRADAVRVVSQKIASYISSDLHIDSSAISVVPIRVHVKTPEKKTDIDLRKRFPQFEKTFLAASRFVKQKNIPFLIHTFSFFLKKYPKAGLVIVGSGPQKREYERLIVSLGISASVVIRPWVDSFASCMKTSDVFVLSSDYEGWGMTVVEAATFGRPIIMTDVGCAGEFIENNINGVVIPVRDSRALISAMERLYTDTNFALSIGEHARKSTEKTVSERIYLDMIKKSWERATITAR